MNNSDLVNELYKTSYFVGILNYNTPAAMQLNKILTPIWVFIGIFGNSISAMVWANPRMRTCNTAAYYLTCLSIADLTFLILCFIYELENPWLLGTLDLLCWCQVFNMANMAVQYFCVFLVFAFTFERFLSMCFPFKSERFGKTRTPRIIFCLLTIAILMSTPQAYFWDIHPIVGECRLRLGISVSEDSPVSFFIVYTWCSEIAVFGLLPLLVLLFNIAVVLKIRSVGKLTFGNSSINSRVSSRRGTCHSTSLIGSQQNLDNTKLASSRSNGGADTKTNNYKGTTVTLLWVSFFLILTMLPNTLMYAMQEFVTYGPIPCRVEDMSRDVSDRPKNSMKSLLCDLNCLYLQSSFNQKILTSVVIANYKFLILDMFMPMNMRE